MTAVSSASVRPEDASGGGEDAPHEVTGAADPGPPPGEGGPGTAWPAAGTGSAGEPAQVFRPEAGAAPAGAGRADAAEPAVRPATRAEYGWDDGLIARRARRAPGDGAPKEGPHGEAPPATGPSPVTGPAADPSVVPSYGERPYDGRAYGERPSGAAAGAAEAAVGGPGQPPSPARPAPACPESADGAHAPEAYARRSAVPSAPVHAGQGHRQSPRPDHGPGPGPRTGPGPTDRSGAPEAYRGVADGVLRRRLGALRELIGLSRTRLEGAVLAEAGRVLDEAGARGQLSCAYTTVAIAGATGSGKSSLFNALAGRALSEVGMRRPTTAEPVACTWEAEREGGADGLLDRLGIAPGARRRVKDAALHGLVLVDLPDHDSVSPGHREQVDRLLGLVDAVVWVVDPEKYADAMLHECYLRPLAGHAEVSFVVLNQTDRLPGDAADAVLDDLRRLLDEDGMALGEHGEPGARVLAISALTGEGIRELREELGAFVATREAPGRRLTADLDGAAERLRPVYADPALTAPAGLTEHDREDFEDRLAAAVGASAAGQSAERAWLRYAERSCGTPWSQLVRWADARRQEGARRPAGAAGAAGEPGTPSGADVPAGAGTPGGAGAREAPDGRRAGGAGPDAAGVDASEGAEDAENAGAAPDAPGQRVGARVARPVLAQAVRELADRAVSGLPEAWRKTVREAAWRGAEGLPEALDAVVGEAATGSAELPDRGMRDGQRPVRMTRPPWWAAATMAQGLLLAFQVLGVFLLVTAVFGAYEGSLWTPVLLLLGGALCAPLLAAGCRAAARGPARAYGQEEERRLRQLAAGCGRTRVLEPVAAELLRYREVREQYVIAVGDAERV